MPVSSSLLEIGNQTEEVDAGHRGDVYPERIRSGFTVFDIDVDLQGDGQFDEEDKDGGSPNWTREK